MTDSDKIISIILTYASYENPMTAADIHGRINATESLQGFQRTVTKAIELYQEKLLESLQKGNSGTLILSVNDGYYPARNISEKKEGYGFYIDRIYPMFKRGKVIRDIIELQEGVKIKHHREVDLNELSLFT